MIEPTLTWMKAVKNAINNLQNEYNQNQGMILTEGDLECYLFNELLKQPCLSGYHPAKDDSFLLPEKKPRRLKTTYIHSQVTWFKDIKQSGYEVDLTICDPQYLEIENIETFEIYPHKGYAYDGPCVAIELKFMRDGRYPKQYDEDYFSLRDNLIPDKLENIRKGKYKVSNQDNTSFVTVVGCKKKEQFDKAKVILGRHLSDETKPCPENLFVCVFYQDEIIWDKEQLIEFYEQSIL